MIDEAMQPNVSDHLEPQKAQQDNTGRATQQLQQSRSTPRPQSDRCVAPGQGRMPLFRR